MLVQKRGFYAANRERERARVYTWKDLNRDIVAAMNRSWRLRHPDRTRELGRSHRAIRRARLNGTACTLTRSEWSAILEVFDYRCAYCLRGDVYLHQEHVWPLALSGGYTAENIVPSWRDCNVRKGAHGPLHAIACAA